MKIYRDDSEVIRGAGVSNEIGYTMKASAAAFDVLSNALYSNKLGSIIRELSCNALDSHIAAGKADVPIEVIPPTTMNPMLVIKDYGTGMSPEDTERVLTTYFESTKQDSDEEMGGYGVGSKTPFCYTDKYSVASRWNGTEYFYSMFINEDGIPSMVRMGSAPTDEINGMTFSLGIKNEDINKAVEEVKRQCKYFDPLPYTKDIVEFKEIEKDPVLQGLDWYVDLNARGSSPVAVLGYVPYRVAIRSLMDNWDDYMLSEEDENKRRSLRAIKEMGLVIKAPINSFQITVSREDIQYTKRTKTFLVERMRAIAEEIYLKLAEQFKEECTTFWKAKQWRLDLDASQHYLLQLMRDVDTLDEDAFTLQLADGTLKNFIGGRGWEDETVTLHSSSLPTDSGTIDVRPLRRNTRNEYVLREGDKVRSSVTGPDGTATQPAVSVFANIRLHNLNSVVIVQKDKSISLRNIATALDQRGEYKQVSTVLIVEPTETENQEQIDQLTETIYKTLNVEDEDMDMIRVEKTSELIKLVPKTVREATTRQKNRLGVFRRLNHFSKKDGYISYYVTNARSWTAMKEDEVDLSKKFLYVYVTSSRINDYQHVESQSKLTPIDDVRTQDAIRIIQVASEMNIISSDDVIYGITKGNADKVDMTNGVHLYDEIVNRIKQSNLIDVINSRLVPTSIKRAFNMIDSYHRASIAPHVSNNDDFYTLMMSINTRKLEYHGLTGLSEPIKSWQYAIELAKKYTEEDDKRFRDSRNLGIVIEWIKKIDNSRLVVDPEAKTTEVLGQLDDMFERYPIIGLLAHAYFNSYGTKKFTPDWCTQVIINSSGLDMHSRNR